jgi:hypothetical protein
MLGLIAFRSDIEQPEQAAPAIQIAGYSTTLAHTVILLHVFTFLYEADISIP